MRDGPDEILSAVLELRRVLPQSGGRIEVNDGPDEIVITGDDLGFRRLGVGLLHGTLIPPSSVRGISDAVDFGAYDVFEQSGRPPVIFRRVSEWPTGKPPKRSGGPLRDAGCLVGAAIVMFLAFGVFVIGVGTIIGWIRGG